MFSVSNIQLVEAKMLEHKEQLVLLKEKFEE
jgi:hypothetical protein